MNRKEYLLTQAASECMEVAHRITKAMHFGLKEIQPGQPYDNSERIVQELIDLYASIHMLVDEGHIEFPREPEFQEAFDKKIDKVEKFMAYATLQGTLKD